MTAPIDMTPAGTEKSSAEIEHEIQQTREQVARDIDALTDKLKPSNLAAGATDQIRGAGEAVVKAAEDFVSGASSRVSGYGTRVIDLIEEHPVPVALAAAGLVWAVTRSGSGGEVDASRHGRTQSTHNVRARSAAMGRSGAMQHGSEQGHGPQNFGAAFGETFGDVSSQSSSGQPSPGRRGQGSETLSGSQMARGVGGLPGAGASRGVKARIDDFAGRAGGKGRQAMQRGREVAERTQVRAKGFFENNPLGAALAVFAAGVALGFAIPVSETERRTLGPTRDKLLDEARGMAGEAKAIAQRTFEETKGAVREGASGGRLGEVVNELKQEVTGVARRAADVASDTARREAQQRDLVG